MSTVQEYITQHNLKEIVEEAINACVRDKSDEPVKFLSNYLAAKVTPP